MTRIARFALLAAVVAATWSVAGSEAAAQRSLASFQVNGVVLEGEATDPGYEGYVGVQLVGFGASLVPGGTRLPTVRFSTVRVRVAASHVTTGLMEALARNSSVNARIVTLNAAGRIDQDLQVTQARVVNVRSVWSDREGRTVVEIELGLGRITVTSGDGTTFTWEVPAAV